MRTNKQLADQIININTHPLDRDNSLVDEMFAGINLGDAEVPANIQHDIEVWNMTADRRTLQTITLAKQIR